MEVRGLAIVGIVWIKDRGLDIGGIVGVHGRSFGIGGVIAGVENKCLDIETGTLARRGRVAAGSSAAALLVVVLRHVQLGTVASRVSCLHS